jgi:hypothetical protein
MAKHGVVSVNAEGVATFNEGAGIVNYASDALSTIISTDKAVVGYGALVQKVGLFALGNMAGIHSGTGRLGVGIMRKNIFFGK